MLGHSAGLKQSVFWGALACSRDSPFLMRQLGAKGLPIVHPQPSQAVHLQLQGRSWGCAECRHRVVHDGSKAAWNLTAVFIGSGERKIVDLSKNL